MTQFVSFISLVTFLTNINAITIIQTPLGQIKANRIVTTTGIEIIESLNIPFATPPIAALRFATPQTIKPWKSIIDGTKFGPACSQVNATLPYISEDCLTLNIWKPSGLTSNQTTLLPVLVWVFGGGLTSGSGIQYNGTKLAALGNVVIVTINYRLGALGLYASKAISNEKINHQSNGAMNSVADVIESLKFVQKYISYFGGDPTQVTVAGESSGSMNSCILAFSKQAKHLFHRLILESGACKFNLHRLTLKQLLLNTYLLFILLFYHLLYRHLLFRHLLYRHLLYRHLLYCHWIIPTSTRPSTRPTALSFGRYWALDRSKLEEKISIKCITHFCTDCIAQLLFQQCNQNRK